MTVRYYFVKNTKTNKIEMLGPTSEYYGEIGDKIGDSIIVDYAEESYPPE